MMLSAKPSRSERLILCSSQKVRSEMRTAKQTDRANLRASESAGTGEVTEHIQLEAEAVTEEVHWSRESIAYYTCAA